MRRWWPALALGCAACAVDVGSTPDAAPCAAAPDLFVSSVWPRYLAASSCGLAGSCHDFSDGQGYFRLRIPEAAPPAPDTPLPQWPAHWRDNYLASVQLLDCRAPLSSLLVTIPEGDGDLHPPGPVVRDRMTAAAVLQAWAASAP